MKQLPEGHLDRLGSGHLDRLRSGRLTGASLFGHEFFPELFVEQNLFEKLLLLR